MKGATDFTMEEIKAEYEAFKSRNLHLDMSRGKPAPTQLDLNNSMLDMKVDYMSSKGVDARNYGVLEGLPECREFFGELLGLQADQIIIGGNSSLNMMYDAMARLYQFGTEGEPPWNIYKYAGKKVKFLCPSPGYDRHFTISEEFEMEMIPIPLLEDGPDMEMITEMVMDDEMIKGIWCVPLYSNPQGVCYSDQVVKKLATMETAAKDFRIFWDNAYGIHHIYEETKLLSVFDAAGKEKRKNRIFYFFSTSKISFPGAGVAILASGKKSIAEAKKHMAAQTIGSDKLNQLRHLQYYQTPDRMKEHMQHLADELRPKFDMVLSKLEQALGGTGFATWSKPKGGYFVSVDTLPGCAKKTVALAKEAGVILTDAGATYPYGNDEKDTNIRIAPSYPSLEELEKAMELFCICVKLVGIMQQSK